MTKEQLTQLLKDGLLDAVGAGAKIKAEALVASAMGVSNFGRMVNPTVELRKTRFYPGTRQLEELEEELEGNHGGRYVTVNVTRVQFTDKMLQALAAAASDTICNEELEPQRSLMESAARTLRRIEVSAAAASNAIGQGKEELPQADLLRRALRRKLASTATAFESCRARIAEIDRGVTDALAAEMSASEQEREMRRLRVRIRQLERDQDGAEIMAFLNGVSDEVYEAHNGLRAAHMLRLDGKDPMPEVKRVALALGVKIEPMLAEAGAIGVPSAGEPKGGAALLEVRGAPASLRKETLAMPLAPAPEPKLLQICNATRPSRL